jgi:DNA-binding response OmpR family regulator
MAEPGFRYRIVPGRIAVIEDDDATRAMLVTLFEGAGFRVDAAATGAEGIAVVEREHPDLVLCDLLMPDVGGLEVTERIRKGPASHAQIVILSGADAVEDKVKVFEVGADDYLVKPVPAAELVVRVRAMLGRAENLRQQGARRKGRLIAVLGAKGGIGTSSVAINLATSYGKRKADSVVLADLAVPVGTLGIMLGLPIPERWVWREFVLDGASSDHLLTTYLMRAPNLPMRLLPGVRQGSPYRDVSVDAVNQFAAALHSLAEVVVVDLGNQPSPFVPPVLRQANDILIVVEPEVVAVELTAHLLERLQKGGILADRIHLVLSNPHGSLQLNRAEVATALKTDAIGAITYQRDEFSAASKRRLPVVIQQAETMAARQFDELALALVPLKAA